MRPETVHIVLANGAAPENGVAGEVISHTFLGATTRVRVIDDTGERTLTGDLSTTRAAPLTVGTRVVATFPPDSPRLLSLADQQELPALDPDDH